MSEWIINKIGLINFWYYDEEEFEFSDGRLLLRGANGSGKSVTMQSFIPLLLDGNRSAKRLDPFGTSSRKIENYLLTDGDTRDENTGYLYMEFVKKSTEKYLTIGIGLRARRGKTAEFWGFSITDGKRIGKDFFLYKKVGDKIPLTKRELKNRITDSGIGEFCESSEEYKAMVNNYVFGFEDITEYDQLIDLLVQLRSPKLSKDYKPTVLYEIMEESLKPLSDEDLRPISEAIENMDNIELSIKELKSAYDSANKLKTVYDKYNSGVLYYKAEAFINSVNALRDLEDKTQTCIDNIRQNQEILDKEINEKENLEQLKICLEDKLRKYRESDLYKINERLVELNNEIAVTEKKLSEKENSITEKHEAKRRSEIDLREFKNKIESAEVEFSKLLSDISDYAKEAAFGEHKYFSEDISNSENFDFTDIYDAVKNYGTSLKNAVDCFKMLEESEKEYDRTKKEYSKEKENYDKINFELKRAVNTFNEEKGTFIENLYAWNKNNTQIILTDEQLQKTSQFVYAFEDFGDINNIKSQINAVYNDKKASLNTCISIIDNKKQNLKSDINKLTDETKQTESQAELVPKLTDEQKLFRDELDKHKIPYIPLYRACDFNPDMTDGECAVIEEALTEMGLLNALIIPNEYRIKLPIPNGSADKILIPLSHNKKYNSTMPLYAEQDTVVPKNDIEEIIAEIFAGNGEIYINKDGKYSISILKGFTCKTKIPKYIGEKSRRRHKEDVLNNLKTELLKLTENNNSLSEKEKQINSAIETLETEYNNLPLTDDIITALSILKNLGIEEQNSGKKLKRLQDNENAAFDVMNERRRQLDSICKHFDLPKISEKFNNAYDYMDCYRTGLEKLSTVYNNITAQRIQIKYVEEKNEELGDLIDKISVDIRDIKLSLNKAINEKKNCEELKEKSGNDDIEQNIYNMQNELNEIPNRINTAVGNISACRIKNQHNEEELKNLNMQTETAQKQAAYYETIFSEELNLGYNDIKADNILKAAASALKAKCDKSLQELRTNLSKKYYEEKNGLIDYSVTETEYFTEENPHKDSQRARTVLVARIGGKETDFYSLTEYLEKEIDKNESLITLKDKELFEELLIDTLGRKIRAKISGSERWVAEMNKKMISMDTSSGLSFSLEWKSKPAESQEQMHTKELVTLLKTDIKLITDENTKKISKHFRSKLNMARLRRDENDNSGNMHTILKEILDYRKWFEFKLFYKMTGETKKELTNTAFYRFSGGEKAMAMYVPLFASVYARYEKASDEAPKLISLDEAFAGIDDKNIADMFRIMEELKLSYIINSQVLWGTYSTVPSLAICELVRPNNADTVSVIRYRWNGKNKELII